MDLDKILQLIQASQIVIAGIMTLAIFYVRSQIRGTIDKFKNLLLEEQSQFLEELDRRFYRKAELPDDWPLSRREFHTHEKYDREMHDDMEQKYQRVHDRFRAVETALVDLNVQKLDRRDWIREQQSRRLKESKEETE